MFACYVFLFLLKHAQIIYADVCEWDECSKFSSSWPDLRNHWIAPVPSLFSWVSETSNTHDLSHLLSFGYHLHSSEGKKKSYTDSSSRCRRCFHIMGSGLILEAQREFLHLQKWLISTVSLILLKADVSSWANFRVLSSALYPRVNKFHG